MGKGAVPMSDPHCLFTMGLQSRDYINLALDEADLVVSVGYDLVEYAPSFWNHDRSTRIVHIDFEPAEIDSHYPVVLDIQADIADALWQINEALNRRFDDEAACRCSTSGSDGSCATPSATTSRWRRTTRASR